MCVSLFKFNECDEWIANWFSQWNAHIASSRGCKTGPAYTYHTKCRAQAATAAAAQTIYTIIPNAADSRRKQFDKYLYYKSNALVILTAWFVFVIVVVHRRSNTFERTENKKSTVCWARWFSIWARLTTIVRDSRFVHMCAPETFFFWIS